MSKADGRPASIAGIKRFAKQIASEKSIKHTAALDEAAKLAGYQTFLHAKRSLEPVKDQAKPERKAMFYSDFHQKTRARWARAINALGARSLNWTDPALIRDAIEPFLGRNYSHAHLPTGGGFDFWSVRLSREPGCLDFQFGERSAITVKPRDLLIERIDSDPAESFVLLRLDSLEPTGVYGAERSESMKRYRVEELLEIEGRYYSRDGLDDGWYVDADGHEQDLPRDWRLVARHLDGQIMIVCKGSFWNGSNETYDGLHDKIDVADIRHVIEEVLRRRDAAE